MALHPSASEYTPLHLKIYDSFSLGFITTVGWRCPTSKFLLPFFLQHAGHNHLYIGVGTGYFTAHAVQQHKINEISLLDLNPHTLDKTSKRVEAAGLPNDKISTLIHDVFTPLPAEMKEKHDAVSLFYLLHCLPGRMSDKAPRVFGHLKEGLKPGGTLYGSTVLGEGVKHNIVGKMMMKYLNSKDMWSNYQDGESGLKNALERHFDDVEVQVVGAVALFKGNKPFSDAKK